MRGCGRGYIPGRYPDTKEGEQVPHLIYDIPHIFKPRNINFARLVFIDFQSKHYKLGYVLKGTLSQKRVEKFNLVKL